MLPNVTNTETTPILETFNGTTKPGTTEYDYVNPGTTLDKFFDGLLTVPLIISFYVTFMLGFYEFRIRRNYYTIRMSRSASAAFRRTATTNRDRKNMEFRYIAPWLRLLCLLGAICSLMRCVNDFLYYKLHRTTDMSCTSIKNLGDLSVDIPFHISCLVSWLVSVDTFVYMFLWLRQRVIYSKKSLKHFAKWYIHLMSWISLFLVIIMFIVLHVLLGFRRYVYLEDKGRCKRIPHIAQEIYPHMWTSSSTALHILLVLLYVYPLAKHAIGTRPQKYTTQNSTNNELMTLVKRCVIISLICVVTDALTMVITTYWITADHLTKLRHSIYNINAILNIICIVMSLKKWESMLIPMVNTRDPNTAKTKEMRSPETQFTTTRSSNPNIHNIILNQK